VLVPLALSTDLVVGLATAIGTLVIVLGTLAVWRLTHRSERQHEIEQLVNAQITSHLHTFLQLGERVARLADSAESLQSKVEADHKRMEQDRVSSEEVLKELLELRDKWGKLVPTVEAIEDSPELLLNAAQQAVEKARRESDTGEMDAARRDATAFLRRLLLHPDAESSDLELAGDFARQELRSLSLARELYERAVAVDGANVSAQAELYALSARRPAERLSATQSLVELMERHPEAKNARISLFNHFIESNQFTELETTCRKLLEVDENDLSAWRNLGSAIDKKGGDPAAARKAYERALTLARHGNDAYETGNVAKAYASFLVTYGNDEDLIMAHRMMNEVLLQVPEMASLHIVRGDVLKRLGDLQAARQSYLVATQLGSTVEEKAAQGRLREMAILEALGLIEVPAAEDESTSMFSGAVEEAPVAATDTPDGNPGTIQRGDGPP
jgi:Tfp pilus assembly protein PilF